MKKILETATEETLLTAMDSSFEQAEHSRNELEIVSVIKEDQKNDPADNSRLIELEEAISELDPEARKRFHDNIIAEHYGVKYEEEEKTEMVKYEDFERNSRELGDLVKSFSRRIKEHIDVDPYHWSDRRNLSWLVKSGVIDKQTKDVYLAALEKVDITLYQSSLEDKYSEHENRSTKYGLGIGIVTAIALPFTTVTVVAGLIAALPIGLMVGGSIGYLHNKITKENEARHQKKLIEHIENKTGTLDQDIKVALEYSQKLHYQLSHPKHINKKYSENSFKFKKKRTKGIQYLNKTRSLLSTIHEDYDKFENE